MLSCSSFRCLNSTTEATTSAAVHPTKQVSAAERTRDDRGARRARHVGLFDAEAVESQRVAGVGRKGEGGDLLEVADPVGEAVLDVLANPSLVQVEEGRNLRGGQLGHKSFPVQGTV